MYVILFLHSEASDRQFEECLSLNSDYVTKGFYGLVERLKEMPCEWTLVQITRYYDPKEICAPRPPNKSVELGELFITRYQCGKKYKKM